jgi:hypothetical protein
MLTQQSVIDKIEVLEGGEVQVRRADRVLKEGVVLVETYHRHVLKPGDDIETEDPRVQAIARAVWQYDSEHRGVRSPPPIAAPAETDTMTMEQRLTDLLETVGTRW